tara:strand:+ start:183 stop:797 length:615 start_codon:yes stop_codon:yes gene_type:complete
MEIVSGISLFLSGCFKNNEKKKNCETIADKNEQINNNVNKLNTRISVLETKLETINNINEHSDFSKEISLIEQNIAVFKKCVEDVTSRRSVEIAMKHINDVFTMKIENVESTHNLHYDMYKEQITKQLESIIESTRIFQIDLKDIKSKVYCKLESLDKSVDLLDHKLEYQNHSEKLLLDSLPESELFNVSNNKRNTFTGIHRRM